VRRRHFLGVLLPNGHAGGIDRRVTSADHPNQTFGVFFAKDVEVAEELYRRINTIGVFALDLKRFALVRAEGQEDRFVTVFKEAVDIEAVNIMPPGFFSASNTVALYPFRDR